MTVSGTEHERIEELLAGFALRALDDGDAAEAELVLAEHVPDCASCRALLADFQSVTGELALAAPPADPSALLAGRIRRSMGGSRRPRARLLLGGAAAALMLVLAGSTALFATRATRAEAFQDAMAEGFRTLTNPDSESVDMAPDATRTRLYVTYLPGSGRMVLMGLNLPAPSDGEVYRLWGIRGGSSKLLAEFRPDDDGLVAIRLKGTPEAYDRLVCATEGGEPGSTPGPARWGGSVGSPTPEG